MKTYKELKESLEKNEKEIPFEAKLEVDGKVVHKKFKNQKELEKYLDDKNAKFIARRDL